MVFRLYYRSFFPALGQLIKGEVLRAIAIFIIYVISAASIVVGIGLLTTPIIHLWQAYDAYNH